jgi:hypothetical protein
LINDLGETGFIDGEFGRVPSINLLLGEVDDADTDLWWGK